MLHSRPVTFSLHTKNNFTNATVDALPSLLLNMWKVCTYDLVKKNIFIGTEVTPIIRIHPNIKMASSKKAHELHSSTVIPQLPGMDGSETVWNLILSHIAVSRVANTLNKQERQKEETVFPPLILLIQPQFLHLCGGSNIMEIGEHLQLFCSLFYWWNVIEPKT